MEETTTTAVAENLARIKDQIAEAAKKAGRAPEEVRLVAVSKTKPVEMIREAFEAGQRIFGENRVQELKAKYEEFPEPEWHLVGNLQRNKVKYIVEWVDLIHSLDSERLMRELNKRAKNAGRRYVDCLLQVNISQEEQKHGTGTREVVQLLDALPNYPNVRVQGLMGIAEFTQDQDVVRWQFSWLRETLFKLQEQFGTTEQLELKELSMGMSGDFPLAIEEGATLVRVGSSIFGARN